MLRRIAVILVLGGVALVAAPRVAEADCRTTQVCWYQAGRRVCRSEVTCTRTPVCTYVNRCVPQRICTTSYGRTTCIYRDVCTSQRVCT
ncbi:MAG: hypothetical protein KIT84_31510 [Labilithrix sp.]|nr:hypothetical protein [Labilithrix sp.]MCW5815597.1 hypothetical protein [Labilithrix sp.]